MFPSRQLEGASSCAAAGKNQIGSLSSYYYFCCWFGKLQGKSPAVSKPHGTCHAGSVVGVCILKCTADVNARAIAERRNGGMFHLIPLTRSTRKVCLAIGRACMSCVCVSIFYFIIRSFASRAAYSDLKDMRSGAIGLPP